MRLTQLEIENFKCIGERQCIDIRPITLLFGANSAGKSTVFHAIRLLRGVLTDSISYQANAGDFKDWVHKKDISRVIKIRAKVKINQNFREELFPLNSLKYSRFRKDGLLEGIFENIPLNYFLGEQIFGSKVSEVALSIEIRHTKPIVEIGDAMPRALQKLVVEINNKKLLTIKPNDEHSLGNILGNTLAPSHFVEFDFKNVFLKDLSESFIEEVHKILNKSNNLHDLHESSQNRSRRRQEEAELRSQAEAVIDEYFSKKGVNSSLYEELLKIVPNAKRSKDPEALSHVLRVGLHEFNLSPGPTFEHPDLNFNFAEPGKKSVHPTGREAWRKQTSQLRILLTELVLGPISAVSGALDYYMHLDALRQIPSNEPGFLEKPDTKEYWKLLDRSYGDELVSSANAWLEQINFGYKIEVHSVKQVKSTSDFAAKIESNKSVGWNKIQRSFSDLPTLKHIELRDRSSDILLSFHEVGVGTSQLVPVILAVLHDEYGMLTIEQPELHIHPKLQVELGDLFLSVAKHF